MRFSWKALVLAPLAVPLGTAICCWEPASAHPVNLALFVFVLGSAISFGTAIFLFLPGLFVFSKLTRLRLWKVSFLGFMLGAVVYLPLSWVAFQSSGPDSGPPEGTFWAYLFRSFGEGITWVVSHRWADHGSALLVSGDEGTYSKWSPETFGVKIRKTPRIRRAGARRSRACPLDRRPTDFSYMPAPGGVFTGTKNERINSAGEA